jgi:L-ribulose-5-phosphate 4-epimerase
MNYENERCQIINAALELKANRLISLAGGNVSMRTEDNKILVTPSAMAYETMQPEDICLADIEGNKLEGIYRPSSDLAALAYIYRQRPDINAIIHTHQPYATAVGFVTDYFEPCLVTQIDANRGGVHVAPFTVSSDIGMGILTVEHIGSSYAVILKGHGVIAVGPDMECCLTSAVYLEEASITYLMAKACGAQIEALSDEIVRQEMGDEKEWLEFIRGNRK